MPQPTPAFDMHRIAPAPHGLPTRRQALATGAAALAAAAWGLPRVARAQGDGKPLRVILPLSAGSGADGAIRAISTSLAKALGQPIVIENLPNPSVYKNILFDSRPTSRRPPSWGPRRLCWSRTLRCPPRRCRS